MPNQNYCRPSEDIVMADCDLSLPFASVKNEERLCKYSYASWCPICDKESPRRRTRSETNEPCKRKGKDMKTFTPKKYNRCQEYENMELEYEMKDFRHDCCRVNRSNLVELPTTYISNNCQLFTNMSNITKLSSGNSDYCEKLPKSFEKLVDFNNTSKQFYNASDKHLNLIKSEQNHIENQKANFNKADKKYSLNVIKTSNYETRKTVANHLCEIPNKQERTKETIKNRFAPPPLVYLNSYYNGDSPIKIEKYNFEGKQDLLVGERMSKSKPTLPKYSQNYKDYDLKYRDTPDTSKLLYNTCTLFDKKDFDVTDLGKRYINEVETLRHKLVHIKKISHDEYSRKLPNIHREIIQINSSSECGEVQIISDVASYRKAAKNSLPIKSNCRDVVKVKEEKDYDNVSPTKSTVDKTGRAKGEKSQRISVKARPKFGSGNKLRQARCKVPTTAAREWKCEKSDLSDAGEETAVNIEEEPANTFTTPIKQVEGQISAGDGIISWPLRNSLFPNIPPYISFYSHDSETPFDVPNGRKHLKWKLSTITPIVVKKTLTNTGFRLVRKSDEWLGTWGKHMKSPLFKTLKDMQKMNHFPGTFQVGRKDRLWKNLQRLMLKFGTKEFGFIPQTYVLPQDLKLLKQKWEFKNGSGGEIFIIKPPASSRGVGIKVINKWSQLPKKSSLVVQKYIANPYLINGSKFDLRLYVLVTSFNPLRIYLYPDGLARFASAKYSDDVKDLKDSYMHLTNYSINKFSSQYTANEDANACQGHKWTLSKLWEYMEKDGVDTKSLWKSLEGLVIKTIISGESAITQHSKVYLNNRYNCYELFGIDVLLDERLKPWLLEVNISPSLHSASPLDAYIKGPLVKALFDMAQFHLPPKLAKVENVPACFEPKIYTTALLKEERNKHNYFSHLETREEYVDEILNKLTGDDVRHLTQAEDELTVTGPFVRIFPTSQTHKYFQFMEVRYYNRLFDAWECKYDKNRQPGIRILQSLCEQKLHLKVGSHPTIDKSLENMILAEMSATPSTENGCATHCMEDLQQTTPSVNP